MLKWWIELYEYDITFTSRTAINAQALAKFIVETSFTEKNSEITGSDNTTTRQHLPNQEIPCPKAWMMMVDGVVNSQGAGVGIVLKSSSQDLEHRCIRFDLSLSNNHVEYEAMIIGLLWIEEARIQSLEVYRDSQIMVWQMNDEYIVNSENLKDYVTMTKKLMARFKHFLLQKVCRSENIEAGRLAKIASGEEQEGDLVEVEVHISLSLSLQINAIHTSLGTWVDEITQYIELGTLPEDLVKARQIRRQSARYLLHNNILYMRSFSRPLL